MNRVLIIGGGYGGLRAIETLAKYKDIEVTLVDKNPYHYLQTEAYGYIAGKIDINDIAVDLRTWCSGFERVTFIQHEVEALDMQNKSLTIKDETLTFDYMVVATGARTNFFSFIEGLREHSYGVKKLFRAFNFRKEFENIIYRKLQNEASCGEESLNIAIGGAGLSGVEVAAEMARVINSYAKTIGEHAKEIKIHLIDASETILPGTSPYVINNTQKRLEKLGVKILTNAFITKVESDKIIFKSGETLDFCFMIFTGGIKASLLNESLECEKNRINQFIANETLNINDSVDVFAIGDCVEIRNKNDKLLPPTAQTAERSAEYVAKVIRNRIDGVASDKFNANVMGMFVALGGNYAVGELFGVVKVRGYTAYLLKKAITYAYYVGLRLRVNAGFKNRVKGTR
jgi:NADH:ubiquinone reductase (H+-translocating)